MNKIRVGGFQEPLMNLQVGRVSDAQLSVLLNWVN